jgi:RsiW-degrading membrane proteinase PrsW (M82 family)
MIAFYIAIALFIAWIWVDYFRLIDIFQKNNLGYVLLVFILGGASVLIVTQVQHFILNPSGWQMDGGFLNQFAYAVFGIGLVEEVAKLTPFLLFHGLFRKHLVEPIDYIAFICVSALGFSAVENVLYFHGYGADIISSRAILCSISHMFYSAIVAYGFVLVRFHPKYKNNPAIIFICLLLAALGHGIYDFWLIYEGINFGYFVTLIFFFGTISIFAAILTNAINNSTHFTYKKVIDIDFLSKRMMTYYGIVFLAQFVLVAIESGIPTSLISILYSLFTIGLIVFVSVLRMSRFQLIEGRWNPIKFQMPFEFNSKQDAIYEGFQPFGIRVRGASFNEIYLSQYYEEYVEMHPVSPNRSKMRSAVLAYVEKKIFLKNDQAYFLLRVYENGLDGPSEECLVKPKSTGITKTKKNYPIVAKMEIIEVPDPKNFDKMKMKYRFVEWVFLKGVQK